MLERPRPFTGQEADFPEFKFRLMSYMGMFDDACLVEIEAAEQHGDAIAVPENEAMARRGRML